MLQPVWSESEYHYVSVFSLHTSYTTIGCVAIQAFLVGLVFHIITLNAALELLHLLLGVAESVANSQRDATDGDIDVHVVGKDILRFHSIYWPIMLHALGLPITKQVLAHPFFVDPKGEKMSKSKGNILYADELSKHLKPDAIRYYLLSELGLAQDGNVSAELIIDQDSYCRPVIRIRL